MDSWRVDGELNGHSPSQTIQFVNALADVEDARQAMPAGYVTADFEARWRTVLGRWFGR